MQHGDPRIRSLACDDPRICRPPREHLHGADHCRNHECTHRLYAGQRRKVRALGMGGDDPDLLAHAGAGDGYRRMVANWVRHARWPPIRSGCGHQRRLRLFHHGPSGRRRWQDVGDSLRICGWCFLFRRAGGPAVAVASFAGTRAYRRAARMDDGIGIRFPGLGGLRERAIVADPRNRCAFHRPRTCAALSSPPPPC